MKLNAGNRPWLAAGCLVLFGTLGTMLWVTLAGMETRVGVRMVLQAQARWALDVRDAVILLERFGRNGDPALPERVEEALTYPRALRGPLRAAAETPGESERLRQALLQDPLTAVNADRVERLARHFSEGRGREGLELWLRADRGLLRIESVAARLPAVVESEGPGSDQVASLLAEVDAAHGTLTIVSTEFSQALTAWTIEIEERIRRWVVLAALLLAALGGSLLWLAGRHLSRAREKLVESEQRFRDVTDAMSEVFWLTDVDKSRMLYVSPGYETLWGRSREELLEKPGAWMEAIHPDDRERVRRALGGQRHGDYDLEYRIVRPDGEVRWIHDRAGAVPDASGRVTRVAGIAQDITHRKELEGELVRSRAALGVARMARVVGHELNNLLTSIRSHAELALDELHGDAQVAEDLRAIGRASERCAAVTGDLLSISRQQILVPRAVHMERLLEESRPIMRSALPAGVDLSIEVPLKVPPVRIDPGHVRAALTDLLVYMAGAGPELIWVELERIDTAEPIPVCGGELSSGAYVRIALGDGSEGDHAEMDLEGLLAPLDVEFLAGDPGRALEVSAARGVIEQSGGGVAAGPDAARAGARFLVYLPVQKAD